MGRKAKPKPKPAPMTIRVTAADIAGGLAGDCWHCAVALALQRETKDDHAHVYSHDWTLYVEVDSLSVEAPYQVRQFVNQFDDRTLGPAKDWLGRPLQPFTFDLPPAGSKEWLERCCTCEEHVPHDKVDDEGNCPECTHDAEE